MRKPLTALLVAGSLAVAAPAAARDDTDCNLIDGLVKLASVSNQELRPYKLDVTYSIVSFSQGKDERKDEECLGKTYDMPDGIYMVTVPSNDGFPMVRRYKAILVHSHLK